MDEKTISKFTKVLGFKSGEEIKITIELLNTNIGKNKCIKDFLEIMFKEIKELF
jgi:hypothetical protein